MLEKKEKLITFLYVALRNFCVTHLALKRLKDQELPPTISFRSSNDEIKVLLKDICTNSETGELIEKSEVYSNCSMSLSRAIIAESFELILNYCEESSQLTKFKDWKYYNFARIIRHCTSHGTGGTLNKWPPDLEKKGF